MPYYPYFFTLKCHLRVKIQKFFLARFARSVFISLLLCSFRETRLLTPQILCLTLKSLILASSVVTGIILLI